MMLEGAAYGLVFGILGQVAHDIDTHGITGFKKWDLWSYQSLQNLDHTKAGPAWGQSLREESREYAILRALRPLLDETCGLLKSEVCVKVLPDHGSDAELDDVVTPPPFRCSGC